MKTFDAVVTEIHRIVRDVERKSLQELALKTGEEVGELQEAVLGVTGAAGCGYKGKTYDDIAEEAVDVVICALATALKSGRVAPNDLIAVFQKKMRKWEDKLS
jgi:NTP pyrophosphatase (non-canonical NTP hydrolase)